MVMSVTCCISELDYCCGVDEVGEFEIPSKASGWRDDIDVAILEASTGTGYFISTFTDTPTCKAAYEELCKKATLLYQSPPRVNPRHTENKVFVCVFLSKEIE
jgi:hypothetical protein